MKQQSKTFKNSIDMQFVRIIPGSFVMGQDDGDRDERPAHVVHITKTFHISITEVTNSQYEQFAPEHRKLRGIRGLSKGDDEAVNHVSWVDAMEFCRWLSQKEGRTYRLPTEAEWEYACRAGTSTLYHTGDALLQSMLKNQKNEWDEKNQWNPKLVSLGVAESLPNDFGVYDVHGNVEEWCLDWYGPYVPGKQTDPIGYAEGDCKVTRGGSHNTDAWYLRSANRLGALPEDKSWYIGFRVVLGEYPDSTYLHERPIPMYAKSVKQELYPWRNNIVSQASFSGPVCYIQPPDRSDTTPFYKHNHCPSITWCNNGDLLAIWYSCENEAGREMTILGSRLRMGHDAWDIASEFFKIPDRNMTGSSLFNDGHGKLFHINGVEAAYGFATLALALRTSHDNGMTWSKAVLINPDHQLRNIPISGASITEHGMIIQPCDAVTASEGGTAVHISMDGGKSWIDYGYGKPEPDFSEGKTGTWIAGIHAGVVVVKDKRIIALGRGNNISNHMPMSISDDDGKTWTYHTSEFPPISSSQRLVLMNLREGPILLVSFTDSSEAYCSWSMSDKKNELEGMLFKRKDGKEVKGYGIFAALSWDGGATWPIKKIIKSGKEQKSADGGTQGEFPIDECDCNIERMGYLAATQSPDGMIHLVSSSKYYRFNLAWLMQPTD